MIKAVTTVCILALSTATAFASTKASHPTGQAGSMQTAKSDPMGANAKMKRTKVSKTAGTRTATATNGQNNWFGSPNNKSTQTTNNDWFGGNPNNNTTAKGKKSMSAATNNGSNGDWFGDPANGANGTGTARKGRMTKANDTNNNWFAPGSGTSK